MLIPVRITFRGLAPSPTLKSAVRERIAWLDQFYDRIQRCDVLVERPHRHQRTHRRFHVRIELRVPGGQPVVVSHRPDTYATPAGIVEPAHAAIHEAFDAARRQLQDLARRQRGGVKTHGPQPRPGQESDPLA